MAHVLEALLGIILVAFVFRDIFDGIIVPRATSSRLRLGPNVVRKIAWPAVRWLALASPSERFRTIALNAFAPMAFVLLTICWMGSLTLGFALIIHALGREVSPPATRFADALYFAGTSVLTIGYGDIVASGEKVRFTVLAAALCGLATMALLVSFLFVLHSWVQQREQVVNRVTSRAGTPPSGLVLLLRYQELGIARTLSAAYLTWEAWVAAVLESHPAFLILPYFRSSNEKNSWIATMGALLDAACLLLTCVVDVSVGEADLFYWLACRTAKELCEQLGLGDGDGQELSGEDFQLGLSLLQQSGYDIVKDTDAAWKEFSARRAAYMPYLSALSDYLVVPLQDWVPALFKAGAY